MRAYKLYVALIATFAIAGCYHIRYTTNQPPAPAPNLDEWHHDLIFGLAEVSPPVNVSQACPNGFAAVENQETFVNGLVTFLTFSWIWEPTTVTVTCSGNKADAPQSSGTAPIAAADGTAPR